MVQKPNPQAGLSKDSPAATDKSTDKSLERVQKPSSQEGLLTGTIYWIFFMLGFKVMGYSNRLSIGLGAIAGIAAGLISAWWTPTEERKESEKRIGSGMISRIRALTPKATKPSEVESSTEPEAESSRAERFPEYGVMGMQRRKRQRRAVRRFAWLFRKK